jgi:3-hydroxyisobutyrate dehydrogenase
MCANLLRAGYACTVHDRRRETGEPLEGLGARWAESTAAAAASADVVITMLPGPAQVLDVLLGDGDALAAMRPGTVWLDMSTSSHAVSRQVQARADEVGVSVIEAPVAGMVIGATNGTLQIMAGGAPETFERVRPLLDVMGDPGRVVLVGPNGAGYAVKVLLNLLWFAHEVITAEALLMGTRAGVDLRVLHHVLSTGPASSVLLERDVLCLLEGGDYDESFPLALVCKDLGLATDLGRDTATPVEVTAIVEQIFRRALALYGARAGELSAMRLYEDATGTRLRFTPEPG